MGLNVKQLRSMLFELAFVVTRDNDLLDKLHLLAVVALCVQMYAYVLDAAQWNAPGLQHSAGYALLHLPESENATLELSMYCVTAAISSLMIALAFMTCREMIMKGAVASMWALKVLRILAALFATVLLFPALNILLLPFVHLQARPSSGLFVLEPSGLPAGQLFLAISALLLPLYLITSFTVFKFMFDPSPRSEEPRLMARATSSGDALHMCLKVTIVLTNSFAPKAVFVAALWVYCLASLVHDWRHPSYYSDLPNLAHVGMGVAHFVGACWTIWIVVHPDNGEGVPEFAKMLAVSMCLGCVGMVAMGVKMVRLDPVRAIHRTLLAAGVRIGNSGSSSGRRDVAHKARDMHAASELAGRQYSCLSEAVVDNIHLLSPQLISAIAHDSTADLTIRRLLRYDQSYQLSAPLWTWNLAPQLRWIVATARAEGRVATAAPLFERVGTDTVPVPGRADDADPPAHAQDDANYTSFACMLLQALLQLNPHSALLWARYAAITALCERQVDRSQVRRLLTTAMREKPSMELTYTLFYVAKHLQRSSFMAETGQNMNVLDLMRYQHDLRHARMHQAAVSKAALRFWRSLRGATGGNSSRDNVSLADKPRGLAGGVAPLSGSALAPSLKKSGGQALDVKAGATGISLMMTLSDLAQQIAQHERQADMFYSRLVEAFPASRTVLRFYATHVQVVKNEPAAAAAILEYADQLEEEESRRIAESIKSYVRRGSAATGSSGTGNGAVPQQPRFGPATPGAGATSNQVGRSFRVSGVGSAAGVGWVTAPATTSGKTATEEAPLAALSDQRSPNQVFSGVSRDAADAPRPAPARGVTPTNSVGGSFEVQPMLCSAESTSTNPSLTVMLPPNSPGHFRPLVTTSPEPVLTPPFILPGQTVVVDHTDTDDGQRSAGSMDSNKVAFDNEGAGDDSGAEESAIGVQARTTSSAANGTRSYAQFNIGSAAPLAVALPRNSRGVSGTEDDFRSRVGSGDDKSAVGDARQGDVNFNTTGNNAPRPSKAKGSVREGGGSIASGHFSELFNGDFGNNADESGASLVVGISDMLRVKFTQQQDRAVSKVTAVFSRSMSVTLLSLIACIITIYATGTSLLAAHVRESAVVAQAGGLRRTSQEFVYLSRQLEMGAAGLAPSDGKSIAALQVSLGKATGKLSNDTASLFNGLYSAIHSADSMEADSYLEIKSVWDGSDVNVPIIQKLWDPYNASSLEVHSDLWALYIRYLQAGGGLATLPNATFAASPGGSTLLRTKNLDLRFILDNGLTHVFRATWGLVDQYQHHYIRGTHTKNIIIAAVTAIIVLLPSLLTVCVFWPAFATVQQHRVATYALFKTVPPEWLDETIGRFDERDATGSAGVTAQKAVPVRPRAMSQSPAFSCGAQSDAAFPPQSPCNWVNNAQCGPLSVVPVVLSTDVGGGAAFGEQPSSSTPYMAITRQQSNGSPSVPVRQRDPSPSMQGGASSPSTGVRASTRRGHPLGVVIPQTTASGGQMHFGSIGSSTTGQVPLTSAVSASIDPTFVRTPGSSAGLLGEGRAMWGKPPLSGSSAYAYKGTPAFDKPVFSATVGSIAGDADEEAARASGLGAFQRECEQPLANGATPTGEEPLDGSIHESKPLRRVVLPYLVAIAVMLALGLALASLLLQTNSLLGTRALEVNYCGARRSQTYRVMALATEWIRNDATTWGSQGDILDALKADIDACEYIQDAYLYGDAGIGISGVLGRDPVLDAAELALNCPDTINVDCRSLDNQFTVYIATARQLTRVPAANLTFLDPNFKQLVRMQTTGTFSTLLDKAKATLVNQSTPIATAARTSLDVIFGVAFAAFVVAAVLKWVVVSEVRSSVRRTRRVLMMLPLEVSRDVPAIAAYLNHGQLESAERTRWTVFSSSVVWLMSWMSVGICCQRRSQAVGAGNSVPVLAQLTKVHSFHSHASGHLSEAAR